MKKFKLYGKKNNFEGVLATIYVKDGEVVIESQYQDLKELIEKEINESIQKNGGLYCLIYSKAPDDWLINHYYSEPELEIINIDNEKFIHAIALYILSKLISVVKNKEGKNIPDITKKIKKLGYEAFIDKSHIIEEKKRSCI